MTKRIHVSVPASSANLGCGFDTYALALELRDSYLFEPASHDAIEANGKFKNHVPRDVFRNLAFRAFRTLAPTTAGPYLLKATRHIPPQGGLGGSAGAIVGGLVAANIAFQLGHDTQELLWKAAELEGHADNVAAALLGQLVVNVRTDQEIHAAQIPFPDDIGICLIVPSYRVATTKARLDLPSTVTLEDAIANLGRASLFLAALQTSRYELLALATEDFLHQPYRAELNPVLFPCIRAAMDKGAYGSALSGSGPTVIALAPPDHVMRVAGAMADAATESGFSCETYVVKVADQGPITVDVADQKP
tara:strand:+ start:1346 stop:2263 length:918 start_codon:yes stop_codon:yes gene_type:complete